MVIAIEINRNKYNCERFSQRQVYLFYRLYIMCCFISGNYFFHISTYYMTQLVF